MPDGYHDDVTTVVIRPLNVYEAPLKPLHVGLEVSAGMAAGGDMISGTVKVGAVAASREVRLYDRITGKMLAMTFSAEDGSYSFSVADKKRQYIVIALDDETGEAYNAVIADRVTPV
jgi:hypothetical protein